MDSENELIHIVASAAEQLHIDIMLIGAFARNYWSSIYGLTGTPRTTYDVDFSCEIAAWNEFDDLRNLLIQEYHLLPDAQKTHSLRLRHDISLDLVPCGEIADQAGNIAWPPHFDTILCVRGYDIAKQDAAIVSFGDKNIKVVKPYWLALLKLQSYVGNPYERDRDLQDLFFLVSNYCYCINQEERLYSATGCDHDIIEREDFDFTLAGAELILRDCYRFNKEITVQICRFIQNFDQNSLLKAFVSAAHIDSELAEQILNPFLTMH